MFVVFPVVGDCLLGLLGWLDFVCEGFRCCFVIGWCLECELVGYVVRLLGLEFAFDRWLRGILDWFGGCGGLVRGDVGLLLLVMFLGMC